MNEEAVVVEAELRFTFTIELFTDFVPAPIPLISELSAVCPPV